ncbi:MAG: aminotransferase class I/II-fold pyridoxal phosphate-dependent enzyme [Azoarcus sp.]|nr:aminotransferase class I/II-fold pyridoxal phosphate-dependent enzyme [Azoarcus sp.]
MFSHPLHVGRPGIGNRAAFLRRVEQILDSRWLTNDGQMVRELERRIAQYIGVRHCVALASGTTALEVAARALDLSGEVIVPSWTFAATAHALYWQGITPVFADIDSETHNLSPQAVRRKITPRTTGIVGVHLWGRPAPVDALQAIADEYGLKLMFDAAHAFGNTCKGRGIGNFGACEVFSFHATKAFSTIEGGAIATNDDDLAERARSMRNFGFRNADGAVCVGINGKMSEIHAAFGLTSLESLNEVIAVNQANYRDYADALGNVPGVALLPHDARERSNFQYVVIEIREDPKAPPRANRDEILTALHRHNVLARPYFWPGVHAMRPYRDLFPHADRDLPNTIEVAARILVLPTGADIDRKTIARIAAIIRNPHVRAPARAHLGGSPENRVPIPPPQPFRTKETLLHEQY